MNSELRRGRTLPDSPARSNWVRGYRLATSLLVLGTVAYDLGRVMIRYDQSAANYFSYFTIQSNLIAAGVLLWGAAMPSGRAALRAILRGAAVLYLLVSGIGYEALTAHLPGVAEAALPWVDAVLHRLAPVVLVLDWVIDPPGRAATPGRAALWLAYPLVYLGGTLLRGQATGWYPYRFVNPAKVGGYGAVAVWCGGIAAAMLVLAVLVVLAGRRIRLLVT